ncbi:MAG TPA: folylpolyglutamate synthase/dihydrofolate synthase family protein [Myxococcaceae bacterium]|nr:folylpolyglutamate synthase/dihydrofolate synthase family protein [Myxococcaceae bacterium]
MGAPRTPAEALDFLESLSPSVIRLGLDRIEAALNALGHPEREFPALHVAGTNGKGSTCAFAAECLWAQGHRVGLYTSPHLVRINERFRVDGAEIGDEQLGRRILEVLERYPAALDTPPPLTYFEVGTLVALWHFARERVDVAVLETGLGGRLDATTAARPTVTAITPIGIDHTALLGNTLEAIAREKAGILKRGVPAVIARQAPEAFAAIAAAARPLDVPIRVEGRDFWLEAEGSGALRFRGARWEIEGLRPSLVGPHQIQNAAVALACLEALDERGIAVTPDAARIGLSRTRWPGRFEVFPGTPIIVLDGAHNPAGAEALARTLDTAYPGRGVHLVFGVLADKDHAEILRALLPHVRSAHLTPVPSVRSLQPEKYLDLARAMCSEVRLYGSPADALAGARSAAGPEDLVIAAGSLVLVGALRALLDGTPFK